MRRAKSQRVIGIASETKMIRTKTKKTIMMGPESESTCLLHSGRRHPGLPAGGLVRALCSSGDLQRRFYCCVRLAAHAHHGHYMAWTTRPRALHMLPPAPKSASCFRSLCFCAKTCGSLGRLLRVAILALAARPDQARQHDVD